MLPVGQYKIVIPKSQYADYLKHNNQDEIVTIPDEKDGTVSKKRNAILDLI